MDGFSNVSIMKKLVPITRFNKGEANKIFEEVQEYGTRIVMKNNRPACVLMSPEQYESLMEMLSDQILLITGGDQTGTVLNNDFAGFRRFLMVSAAGKKHSTD